MERRDKSDGFSLVELSIVLVILGLLVGGILAGQSLIRASELRSVTTEATRFTTAAYAFRDKYFALPGDMRNATSFWGAMDGNDGINTDCRAEQPGVATCNGDGDRQLENGNSGVNTYELLLIWKHLANAGLIEGSYTGSPTIFAGNTICPTTTSYIGGCNMPASKLGSTLLWAVVYRGAMSADGSLFDGEYGNVLTLLPNNSNIVGGLPSVMRAEELWNIDSKMDDGKPGTGKLVATRWTTCATGAATSADNATASYALATSDIRCVPIFRSVF